MVDILEQTQCAAVIIVTGGDASHTGEELKGPRGPNSSGGTKNSTRLTSKYVLRGKTKKAKILRQLKSSLFLESRRCANSSYNQRARNYQASASPEIQLIDGLAK